MTTPTQPADLLALERLTAFVSAREKMSGTDPEVVTMSNDAALLMADLRTAIASLAAHRGEVAWWVGYSDGHPGRAPFHFIGPDKPNPALWRQSIRWTPLYFHPPQAQAGAGDAALWREWLEHAIATWPDAANALIATASALGPTSPITDEDLAWALAALEAKP